MCQVAIFNHQKISDVKTGEYYQQGYSIPWAEGCSVSYCEADFCVNFALPKSPLFGILEFNQEGGGVSINYNGAEIVGLSFMPSNPSFVDISIVNMKPDPEDDISNIVNDISY